VIEVHLVFWQGPEFVDHLVAKDEPLFIAITVSHFLERLIEVIARLRGRGAIRNNQCYKAG